MAFKAFFTPFEAKQNVIFVYKTIRKSIVPSCIDKNLLVNIFN